MSDLDTALKIKTERAKKAFSIVNAYHESFQNGKKEDLIIFKKLNRLMISFNKKIKEQKDDMSYLKIFFEYAKKISDKYHSLEYKTNIINENLSFINEIKPIVIFDIDDTLRDASHRQWLRTEIEELKNIRNEEEDKDKKLELSKEIDIKWNDFFKEGFKDEPMKEMIELCNMYYDVGFEVRIRTGASEAFREDTINYLDKNGVKYNDLRMRKEGVKIPDYILKPSWISKYDLGENVFASYDDRLPMQEKYQKKGVENTILVSKEFDVRAHIEEIKPLIEKQKKYFSNKPVIKSNRKNKP